MRPPRQRLGPRRIPSARRSALALACAPLLVAPAAAQGGCWREGVPCPQARFEGPSFELDGLLYVVGGFGKGFQALTRVDVHDPSTGAWTSRAPMPSPVTHIGVALDGQQRELWVAGGFVGNHPGVATDQVWVFDVDQDAWSSGPALPRAVAAGALVLLGRDLHWFGGLEADRDTNVADHWVLDLDDLAGGWSPLAPLPEPRCHLSGVALAGRAHAIGGQFRHDTSPVDLDFHHAYDPTTDSWSERAPVPIPRSHFEPGTFVMGGQVVIVGGRSFGGPGAQVPDVTAYDPTADRWTALRPLPEPLLAPAAKLVGNRVFVVAGTQEDFKPKDTTRFLAQKDLAVDELRINCGGGRYVSPVDGAVWCEDHLFLGGEPFENAAVADVAGTDEDELFRTYRTSDAALPGELHYRLPVGDGKWRVRLRFAEILHGATGYGGPAVGQRVMRVVLEWELQKTGIDVAALVGVETALDLVFDVESQGGALDLMVSTLAGEPMLSAIELTRLPDDAWEVFCDATPNSTGAPAGIEFVGSSSLAVDDLLLRASPVPPEFGLYFYGQTATDVPFADGRRCVDAPFFRLPPNKAKTDTLVWKVNLAKLPKGGEILAGSTWIFQAWFRDGAAGGTGSNASRALRLQFTD